MLKKLFVFFILLLVLTACSFATQPRSVILMIGDGMGPEQVKAAGLYYYGEEGSLSFESFSHQGFVTTYSSNNDIADSAASATAMATGQKVNNGVISMAFPGYGRDLETILERFQKGGKAVGVVTTAMVTHATPAAFASHNASRSNYSEIAEEMFITTAPNVVFGGGGSSAGIDEADLETSGYQIAANEVEMAALSGDFAAGLFGDGHMPYVYDEQGDYPSLSEMSEKALNLLDDDPDGFFLMIEGGRIDHACHLNDLSRMLPEMKSFSDSVQTVVDWIGTRDDILLIVTADHETGGLSLVSGNGEGVLPTVTWSTTGHTAEDIPFYLFSNALIESADLIDNTDVYSIIGEF